MGKSPDMIRRGSRESDCSPRLRHEKDPYYSFADCVKRIIDEEGWQTLYRAWWVTVLASILNALAAAATIIQATDAVGNN